MKIKSVAVDIEALGTPELAGYAVPIPNLAIVAVPEKLTGNLDFIYTRIAVQPQLDKGLKVDAGALHFWMADPENTVDAITMINARDEVLKALKGDECVYYRWPAGIINQELPHTTLSLQDYLNIFSPEKYDADKLHFYGKGCHFDYSLLQENIRTRFGQGNITHYSSPQNVRTLEVLFTEEELDERRDVVDAYVQRFIKSIHNYSTDIGVMVLHHPLYDAAREALQIRWMLDRKKSITL